MKVYLWTGAKNCWMSQILNYATISGAMVYYFGMKIRRD